MRYLNHNKGISDKEWLEFANTYLLKQREINFTNIILILQAWLFQIKI